MDDVDCMFVCSWVVCRLSVTLKVMMHGFESYSEGITVVVRGRYSRKK